MPDDGFKHATSLPTFFHGMGSLHLLSNAWPELLVLVLLQKQKLGLSNSLTKE